MVCAGREESGAEGGSPEEVLELETGDEAFAAEVMS